VGGAKSLLNEGRKNRKGVVRATSNSMARGEKEKRSESNPDARWVKDRLSKKKLDS